jgi:hypothetical protein
MLAPYKYRHLLWALIAALDSGDFDHLDIEEVRQHAGSGSASQWFRQAFQKHDLSLLDEADWKKLDFEWSSIDNAIDAAWKFGVESKGISLIMAFVLQGLQTASRLDRPMKFAVEQVHKTGHRLNSPLIGPTVIRRKPRASWSRSPIRSNRRRTGAFTSNWSMDRFCSSTRPALPNTRPGSISRSAAAGCCCTNPGPM